MMVLMMQTWYRQAWHLRHTQHCHYIMVGFQGLGISEVVPKRETPTGGNGVWRAASYLRYENIRALDSEMIMIQCGGADHHVETRAQSRGCHDTEPRLRYCDRWWWVATPNDLPLQAPRDRRGKGAGGDEIWTFVGLAVEGGDDHDAGR
jgi:hypothetical protein